MIKEEGAEKGGRDGGIVGIGSGEREIDFGGILIRGGLLGNIKLVFNVFKGSDRCRILWVV